LISAVDSARHSPIISSPRLFTETNLPRIVLQPGVGGQRIDDRDPAPQRPRKPIRRGFILELPMRIVRRIRNYATSALRP